MSCIVKSMTLVYNVRNFNFGYASSLYPIRAMPVEVWFMPMISSNFSEEFLPHIPFQFFMLDFGCQIFDYISIPGSISRVPTNCVHLSLRFFNRCEIYLITSNVNLCVNIYFYRRGVVIVVTRESRRFDTVVIDRCITTGIGRYVFLRIDRCLIGSQRYLTYERCVYLCNVLCWEEIVYRDVILYSDPRKMASDSIIYSSFIFNLNIKLLE